MSDFGKLSLYCTISLIPMHKNKHLLSKFYKKQNLPSISRGRFVGNNVFRRGKLLNFVKLTAFALGTGLRR